MNAWMWTWNKCGSSFATQSHKHQSILKSETLLAVFCVVFQCIRLFHAHTIVWAGYYYLFHYTQHSRWCETHFWLTKNGVFTGLQPEKDHQHQMEVYMMAVSLGRWCTGVTLTWSCWVITRSTYNPHHDGNILLFSTSCFLLLRNMLTRTHSRAFEVKRNRQ